MVATMRHLFAAFLLLLTASAEAQTFGTSTVETTAINLTASSNVFTPPCPTLGGGFSTHNIIVTAASQSIALPSSCPSSSVGLFVTFNICNGKGGTAPCNGTASGPFSPGLTFGTGYEFIGSTPYAVNSTNGNTGAAAKDIVTCEVMGTTGPWSCGTPQYAMGVAVTGFAFINHAAAQGTNNPVTTGIDTTNADLIVVSMSYWTGGTTPTLTDSKSNTWSQAVASSGVNAAEVQIWYVRPTSKGTGHTFTCSGSSVFCTIAVEAFSGSVASPLDQTNTANSTGVTTLAAGSVTPSQANELIVTAMAANAGTGYSAGSGFTTTDEIDDSGSAFGGGIAYFIQGAAAAINPAWSWTTTASVGAATATFK